MGFLLRLNSKNMVSRPYNIFLTLVEIHSPKRTTLLPYLQSITMWFISTQVNGTGPPAGIH
jgi:hypothetical protein